MKNIPLLIIAIVLVSCVADSIDVQQCVPPDPDGFWMGLWHGSISPITFVFSLFMDDVAIYSVNNNGGWYDFGFVLGIGALGGGASSTSKRS